MIRVSSTTIRKGENSFSITIQPSPDGKWLAVIAGIHAEDMDFSREVFSGDDPPRGRTLEILKEFVERRIKETDSEWNGWTDFAPEELPGQPMCN